MGMGIFKGLQKQTINTDEKVIDDILTRSVAQVLPSREALKKRIMEGQKMRFYVGVDATGPELHGGAGQNFILL